MSDDTGCLISLATARQVRKERAARERADQRLAEQQVTVGQVEAIMSALMNVDPERFRGPPGMDADAPTDAQLAEAVADYLSPRLESLKAESPDAPTRDEIAALIERVISDNPERFRGPRGRKGDPGVGIKSARINMAGELVIEYTDGRSVTLGRVRGKDGEDGKESKSILVMGGGASEGAGAATRYEKALTGTQVTIPASEHGIERLPSVVVVSPEGDVVSVAVNVTSARVVLSSLVPLDGHTAYME